LLNTATSTFDELIGSEKAYYVPPFQRDYSWEEEEWEDLWLDIKGLEEDEETETFPAEIMESPRLFLRQDQRTLCQ
jgi:uncharacterized protein with ParB-like and HNH nuclease domain